MGWLLNFGKYSYCIYLFHLLIMGFVDWLLIAPLNTYMPDFPLILWRAALVTVLSYFVGMLSFQLIEMPVSTFKKYFRY